MSRRRKSRSKPETPESFKVGPDARSALIYADRLLADAERMVSLALAAVDCEAFPGPGWRKDAKRFADEVELWKSWASKEVQ